MEKALASFGSSIISWVMNVLWRKCFRRLYKKLVHLLTGKSEIERLCNFSHENERQRFLLNLSLSILQSKQLKNVPRSMFVHKKSFAPESAIVDSILKLKKISTPAGINARVEVNLLAALQQVNLVNRTIEALDRKKKEAFDSSNSSHEALLERLWASLRPGVRRAGGRVSAEWGEVGFQGQDPATDFRGMGLLGLEQLVHFAEGPQNSAARAALTDSAHPVRYYPFAAAGINLTSFVVELLGARLLDGEVHRRCRRAPPPPPPPLPGGGGGGEGNGGCADGVEAVHTIYGELFLEWNAAWLAARPRDTMDFPVVWGRFVTAVRRRLRARDWCHTEPLELLPGPKRGTATVAPS